MPKPHAPICEECGNEEAAEGQKLCIECLERTAYRPLSLCPMTRGEAAAFVKDHHRTHSNKLPGDKFCIGAHDGERIVGVIIIGRPFAEAEDDGRTLEVTRCCVLEGVRNASSLLYGAARRAAWALGYTRIVTMTLKAEAGSSLRAAGYKLLGERPDRHWNFPGRPRVERMTGEKLKWESRP